MTWNSLSTANLDDILAWAEDQPWCQAMAACRQDAEWHAEGDVWTHTQMVCRQLPQLDTWDSLDSNERIILITTALFHDSCKPQTTQLDPETGRVTSPKHAVKGEHLARSVLRELECPITIREEIARMVRCHSRPVFLLEKPDPNREVVTHSWWVRNKLLYLFCLADTRGRETREMSRPEENLHLWKMVAEENDCYDNPYAFGNNQARFQYFQNPEMQLQYVPHEEYRCTVTMMSGLPGSGKDTWLAQNRPDRPVVSLDELRDELDVSALDDQGTVIQLARERCREYLRTEKSFSFNATSLLRQTRKRWVDLFIQYGARIELVYVEPPLAVIMRQNKERQRNVPESVIRELAEKCEPPTWAECHQLIVCENPKSY